MGTALFLLWGMGALGIIGVEGDPADRMYYGVLAIGIMFATLFATSAMLFRRAASESRPSDPEMGD